MTRPRYFTATAATAYNCHEWTPERKDPDGGNFPYAHARRQYRRGFDFWIVASQNPVSAGAKCRLNAYLKSRLNAEMRCLS
jgi:hypothetical protein